jgi:hypothetical protein
MLRIVLVSVVLALAGSAEAQTDKAKLIASAESAAPEYVTSGAKIMTVEGEVLREGSGEWTCFPESPGTGPMCNQAGWGEFMAGLMKKEPVKVTKVSVSYMLAGEGGAPGVSNIDPFATEKTPDNQWVKEGPHLMILAPPEALEGLSTNPEDPVYVMWPDTPYAHIMIKVFEE